MEPNNPKDMTSPAEDLYSVTVSELLWTEGRYVQGLERLCSLKALVTSQLRLDNAVVHQIFGAVDDILQIHKGFLRSLQRTATRPNQEQRWAPPFSLLDHAGDVYVSYVAGYEGRLNAAIQHQEILSSVTGPREVVQQVADLAAIHLAFQWSYSRFAKYACILKDLSQQFGYEEERWADLHEALSVYNSLWRRVNQALTDNENQGAVAELNFQVKDWKGLNINEFGNLLIFHTLQCRPQAEESSTHELKVYMFDKIFLFFKVSKQKRGAPTDQFLKLEGRIHMRSIQAARGSMDDDPSNELNITWQGDDDGEVDSVIVFPTRAMLNRWIEQFDGAVGRMQPRLRADETGTRECY